MGFALSGQGMSAGEARTHFRDAVAYLRGSDMARSILEELSDLPERIMIKIGSDIEPKYRHPKADDGIDGGIVEPIGTEKPLDFAATFGASEFYG